MEGERGGEEMGGAGGGGERKRILRPKNFRNYFLCSVSLGISLIPRTSLVCFEDRIFPALRHAFSLAFIFPKQSLLSYLR